MKKSKVIVDSDSISELLRMSKTLYLAFQQINQKTIESDDDFVSDTELDYSLAPHKYYKFQFGLKSCSIVKMGKGVFSLLCSGFKPNFLDPYRPSVGSTTVYDGFFGCFTSFDDCLTEYYKCVQEASSYYQAALF